jgi:hypothetical protein
MARNIGWNSADADGGSARLRFGPDDVDEFDEERRPLPVANAVEMPTSILKHGGRYVEERAREVDGVRYDVEGKVFMPSETFGGQRKGYVYRNGSEGMG